MSAYHLRRVKKNLAGPCGRCGWILVILAILASRALAASLLVEIVELRDGSLYQGELLEKVVSDHVTIQLANGGIRSFAWAEIARLRETDVAPTEPGEHLVTGWPEPDRRVPVLDTAHLTLGVEAGLGGPEGYAGITVGWEPTRWLELELGAGLGGKFGPALAQTLRIGLPLYMIRLGLGVSLSMNVTGSEYTDQGAPSRSYWISVEGFNDLLLSRRLLLRFVMGDGILLNGGDFSVLCRPVTAPRPVACTDWGVPTSPASAGGGWSFDLYGSVRLLWLFDL
jgi:hypothetical protein